MACQSRREKIKGRATSLRAQPEIGQIRDGPCGGVQCRRRRFVPYRTFFGSTRQFGDDPAHEGRPRLELGDAQELVGLVGLGDVAGTADHGRPAFALEQPALGAIGDDMTAIVAGQAARQRLGRPVDLRAERRGEGGDHHLDAGGGRDGLHLRLELGDPGAVAADIVGILLAGDDADLMVEAAMLGGDVDRRSALDHADMQRGVGRLEGIVGLGAGLVLRHHLVVPGDQLAGDHHRGHADIDPAGMHGMAAHGRRHPRAALVAGHDLHHRGLADDHRRGLDAGRRHRLGEDAGAQAADLLVIGQGDMDRALQRRRQHLRHQRQRDGVEALHVAGAAAIEPAVALGQRPGIGGPVLARDGHDVGVAGQDDAAIDPGADRGEEVGLLAVLARDQRALDAMAGEVVAAEMDQLEIAALRFRVERNQLGEHLLGRQVHDDGSPKADWKLERGRQISCRTLACPRRRVNPGSA